MKQPTAAATHSPTHPRKPRHPPSHRSHPHWPPPLFSSLRFCHRLIAKSPTSRPIAALDPPGTRDLITVPQAGLQHPGTVRTAVVPLRLVPGAQKGPIRPPDQEASPVKARTRVQSLQRPDGGPLPISINISHHSSPIPSVLSFRPACRLSFCSSRSLLDRLRRRRRALLSLSTDRNSLS